MDRKAVRRVGRRKLINGKRTIGRAEAVIGGGMILGSLIRSTRRK
jgi:hypothetical protein